MTGAARKEGVDQIQRNEELCFDYGQAGGCAPHVSLGRPVSRGRGSHRPFMQGGPPWVDKLGYKILNE